MRFYYEQIVHPDGQLQRVRLGNNPAAGEQTNSCSVGFVVQKPHYMEIIYFFR
jgi:hypothetical protein